MQNFVLENASGSYREKREALRQAEIALKDKVKKVAAMRAALPVDTPVETEYTFTEAASGRQLKLEDLIVEPDKPLLLYHYMWGGKTESPCPMCSSWMDAFAGVAKHVRQRTNLVMAAKQDARKLGVWANERGWQALNPVSTAGTSFNRDFGMEDEDGNQWPGISVFKREADGAVRHVYTGSAIMGEENFNGLDLLNPLWHLFDLLPEGRGDFMPSLKYA